MTKSDSKKFAELMAVLGGTYGKEITVPIAQTYWTLLESHDIRDVERSVMVHMRTSKFFPTPADLLERIEGNRADNAALAWSAVDQAVRRVGSPRSVVFDDPVIHAVVDQMGGWVRLCNSNEDDWHRIQKDFCQRYVATSDRGLQTYPAKLYGRFDKVAGMTNNTVLLGDKAKALHVLQNGVEDYPPALEAPPKKPLTDEDRARTLQALHAIREALNHA